MQIEVIDKKKIINAHKNDYKYYQDYITVIRGFVLNSIGTVDHSPINIPKNPYCRVDKFSDKEDNPLIEITPGFADEEHALYKIGIKLYSPKIDLDSVKRITEEILGNSKGLEKVTIETYF